MSTTLLIARRELAAYLRIDDRLRHHRRRCCWSTACSSTPSRSAAPSKRSAEVLSQFFYFSSGTTMIASVFISMRLLAEERQTGTLALLYSSPVRDAEIVLGKFLSALAFLASSPWRRSTCRC